MAKKARKPRNFKFDCLTFEQADQELVLFLCGAKQLRKFSQVNQLEEDSDKGYQRAVSASRVAKIAKFIDDGNFIPNSVLISFEHAKLNKEKNVITIDNRQDAGWVIDGQHRLAGGHESSDDIVLPVVAFVGLGMEQQIKCFVTINKEQKGVSSSLYLELMRGLPGSIKNATDNAKKRAVDLAHSLKQDELSPFYGRIVSTTSPKKGEISLTNFVRKVHPLLKQGGGRLETFNDDERFKVLSNYYKGLEQNFPEEYDDVNSPFFKTLGFGALISVLPTFLDISLGEYGGKFRVAEASKLFKKISDFDFSSWGGISGSGAEKIAADALRNAILDDGSGSNRNTKIEL